MSRIAYEIRVAGKVPPRLMEDFEKLTISVDPVGTTMIADLADETELHGILETLRRSGLVLVDVRRQVDEGRESPSEHGDT